MFHYKLNYGRPICPLCHPENAEFASAIFAAHPRRVVELSLERSVGLDSSTDKKFAKNFKTKNFENLFRSFFAYCYIDHVCQVS